MGEMTSEGGRLNEGAFDLTQFYQVFFEEAGENLTSMEDLLLAVDVDSPDDEALNAIFRCAHSIKGGAATFGFQDVADLTHVMETLLDRLRRHELTMTTLMVDTLLESGDALKALLDIRQGKAVDAVDTSGLVASIRELSTGASPAPKPAAAEATTSPGSAPVAATVGVNVAGTRTLKSAWTRWPTRPSSTVSSICFGSGRLGHHRRRACIGRAGRVDAAFQGGDGGRRQRPA